MRVLWFVSSLEQKGGGERWVLEGTKAIRALGHDVLIICDRLDSAAGFDGCYDLSDVICTKQQFDSKRGYFSRAFSKMGGLVALFKVARSERPDLILCQSEFDAIKLFAISKLCRFRYRVFVFGQMFQFKSDISKYSCVFREHLLTVMASRPGYRETVILPPPRLSAHVWVMNEVVSRLKRHAIRSADRVFTLSNQVKWEIGLLYGREASVCRAAFDEVYIDTKALAAPRPIGRPARFLSVSRLVGKKRVDLIIRAFAETREDALLIIIGSGSEDESLRALATSCKRSAAIFFLGSVTDDVLQRELAKADCFISMDVGDYDISVVEAMGKGLRVIVADDFDMSEFGSDFAGVQSVQPNVEELSRAMDQLALLKPPSSINLTALRRLTWQQLARDCVAV